ncbi:putative nucleoredoxin 1 [Apium graveolens]|uniref:putative nucleoredoxin 1 n=1 Tax=Apium graveolens TaxID=4045 RepID=UPI003D7AB689
MAITLKMGVLGGKDFLTIDPPMQRPCCFYYNHPATLSCYKSSSTTKLLSVSRCSDPTVYSTSKLYKMEEEAEEGFNTDNKEILKPSFKKGDIINLPDLLFTKKRDYLVKNNNVQVKAKQLEGKVIVIFFGTISGCGRLLHKYTVWLMDVYSDCELNNNFEVVSVPVGVDPSLNGDGHSLNSSKDFFSRMPWLYIPSSDIASRKFLQRSFGVSENKLPFMFIIDPTGKVLQTDWEVFDIYGALGYPFSDERINILKAEDEAIAKQPSLKALLASPQRDYLISNDGEEVPIHILEDKVVVLYFYREGRGFDVMRELLKAYRRSAEVKNNFEVVFIYQRDTDNTFFDTETNTFFDLDKNIFQEEFHILPWLALPYNDPNHKKLRRIFEYSYLINKSNPLEIVIFGPHGQVVEPFASEILCKYGIEAFPFTRMEAAKLEAEKVKELQLGMLWDQNTVFRRKDGSHVRFSQLSGKQVMLYYERAYDDWGDIQFLQMLRDKYLHMKGTDNEFEVIHVVESADSVYLTEFMLSIPYRHKMVKTEPMASLHIGDLPWLVSLETKLLPAEFGSYLCFKDEDMDHPMLFAFDRDGKLVRKTIYPTVEDARFPFYAGNLEEEALTQLTTYFCWDYSENVHEKWRILSYKDFMTEGAR